MEFFIPGGDSRVIVLSDKHIHRQIQMHIQTPTIIIFCSVSRCSRTRSDSYHHGCLLCCVKGELLLYCPVVSDCRVSFVIFRSSVPQTPSICYSVFPTHCYTQLIISLTSSPSSLFITCPYHLNSLTLSAMSTTSHLLISFHNVSDQLSFISSYYVSIPSQHCFPHLLCNVYHPTSSDFFIP